MTDFNSNLERLAKAIIDYNNNQGKWTVVLNNASNTYNVDFSVLLKQNIINTLLEIHESKEKILAASLILITVATKSKNSIPAISNLALENIKNNAQYIASMEIQKSIIDYHNQANRSIAFFKTANGHIYENQLSEAKKILDLWQEILIKVNETSKRVKLIEKDVLLIAKGIDF